MSPRSAAAFWTLRKKSFLHPALLRPLGRSLYTEARGIWSSSSRAKERTGILISTASVPLSGRDRRQMSPKSPILVLPRFFENASVNLARRSLELPRVGVLAGGQEHPTFPPLLAFLIAAATTQNFVDPVASRWRALPLSQVEFADCSSRARRFDALLNLRIGKTRKSSPEKWRLMLIRSGRRLKRDGSSRCPKLWRHSWAIGRPVA